MKRIVYTAVALIICASVFGIADYFYAKKSGKLVTYTDDPVEKTIVPVKKEKTDPLIITSDKKEPEKNVVKNKTIPKKLKNPVYSKDIPDLMKEDRKENTTEIKYDIKDLVNSTVMDTIIKEDEKRVLRADLFSRAPIRTARHKNGK